jgi:adenylosuccinate lyase
MGPVEVIVYAATTVGGVVGGIIASTLRFSHRLKELEEKVAKIDGASAEAAKLLPAGHGSISDMGAVDAHVDLKIGLAIANHSAGLAGTIATLQANIASLREEFGRFRDGDERASIEGARRWQEMSSAIARLAALIEQG